MLPKIARKIIGALRKRSDEPKIKLVAIAKNEAAYLSEWIFHHLYLGIDAIEVHYNRCSDNTVDYIPLFEKDSRVNFIDADVFFENYEGNPQTAVYQEALASGHREGFTHCLFLDIDEFLVPPDLGMRIKNLVVSLQEPEVISFQWGNKCESADPFTRALKQNLDVSRSRHVKSLISTSVGKPVLTPHGPRDDKFDRVMPNGEKFVSDGKTGAILSQEFLHRPLESWFVMHRMFRSQREYVALLARGRPNLEHRDEGVSSLKSNRNGYGPFPHSQSVYFTNASFKKYDDFMTKNLQQLEIKKVVDEGQKYVEENFNLVLRIIEAAKPEHLEFIKKVTNRVTLSEVRDSIAKMEK